MSQADYVKEKYKQLKPREREEFELFLLESESDQAEKFRQEYKLSMLADYYDQIEEDYLNWGKMCGISTGFPTVDRMTMGLVGGEMIVIGGATSTGKSALGINITTKVAIGGRNVLYVTLEMTKRQLGVRIKHIIGDNPATYTACQSRIFFQEQDEMNWQSIDGLMETAKKQAGAELVVIDHLHYFTRELKNVAEDLGNITKEFKKNAIRHDLPVILISHTRKSEKSHETSTGINDLRGSSYIAQDADIVLMVDRDVEIQDKIVVSLEKNRNRYGVPVGTKELLNFNATRISEL